MTRRWSLARVGFALACCLAVAIAAVPVSITLADNAPVTETPEGIAPGIPNTTVQMVSEQVDVQVVEQGAAAIANVTATFDMLNTGPTARVLTGFPSYEYPRGGDPNLPYFGHSFNADKITNFRAWTDAETFNLSAQSVAAADKGELDGGPAGLGVGIYGWFVWSMSYPQGKTLPVHVSYTQKLGEQEVYGEHVVQFTNVIYVLRTGALWSGPIGHAHITFEALNGGAFVGAEGAADSADDHIAWDFINFKPTSDVGTAYIFATPWKALRAAEMAANLPDAQPSDALRAAQATVQLVDPGAIISRLPKGLVNRYVPSLQRWAAVATALDTADSWKVAGDAALIGSGAVGKLGFLSCRPDAAIAAYQKAADLGSDWAAQQVGYLQGDSEPQPGLASC